MGIAAKLVAAMSAMDAVTKRGRNEAQRYNYVKAADVAQEVRKALVEAGIAFTYSISKEERWSTDRINNEGTVFGVMNYVSLHVLFGFIDSDSGEKLEMTGLGWGNDVGDKAPYKAMTGALKYALRMSFLIPDELDPENEKAEVEKEVERQKASPSKFPQAINSVEAAKAKTAILQQQLSDSQGTFVYDGEVLHCIVRGVQKKTMGPNTKTPNKEYRSVTFNGRLLNGSNSASCFDTALWEALDNCLDKECKLQVALKGQYANIEDVVWIQGLGPVEAA